MGSAKRLICTMMTLLLLCGAVLPGIAAEDNVVEPASPAVFLDILNPRFWEGSDAVLDIVTRSVENDSMLYVSAREGGETTLSISGAFDEPLDFSSFREISFTLDISGVKTSQFTVTFLSGGRYYNASTVADGGKTTVYLPIPDEVVGSVDALSLTLTRQEEPIKSFSVLSAKGDNRFGYAHMERFMSAGFEPISGVMLEQEDRVFISAENGSASFYPRYSLRGTEEGSATVCLRIKSNQAVGTIAVQGVTGAAPLTILSGEHTYVFLVNGKFSDLQFVLSGIAATRESPLVVTGAAIYSVKSSLKGGIGSITSCRSDGKTVTVKGTLSSNSVVEHINGELALYIIPVWADEEDVLQEEPAAKMSISTRFELSAVPSEPDVLCKYRVMILSGDDKISVASSVFLNSGIAVSALDSSVTGIHGTDTVDIFESNVSNVILDVYANRLFETEDVYSALLYAAGSAHYYLNSAYIEELDAQIQFCRSSGTKIYIRLLTSEEDSFAYTAADQGSAMQMCALTAFLAQRYQGTAGFIMGSQVNMEHWKDMENFASLAAIFSEIVQKQCPGAATVIPVRAVYNEEAVKAVGISDGDPAVFLSRLSTILSRRHAGSIMILYESAYLPQSAAVETSYLSSIVTAGGHPCDGSILFWQPIAGAASNISEQYTSVCLDAMRIGLRSVVLSVSNINASGELYNGIKEIVFNNTSAQLLQRVADLNSNHEYLGAYPLWDFTASYNIGRWVPGGGFGRIISANAQYGSHRVMQAKLENVGEKAGILLCWLDKPLDLSGCSIVFSFGLYDSVDAEFSIIFGSGDSRAEYLFTTQRDNRFTASCDLGDFNEASSIEYIAVILRGDGENLLEVSKVEVCSNEKTAQQLQMIINGPAEREKLVNPVYYFIIVVMSAATVVIFSMLCRKGNKYSRQNTRKNIQDQK